MQHSPVNIATSSLTLKATSVFQGVFEKCRTIFLFEGATTISITTLSMMTFGTITLSVMIFSFMPLRIKGLYVTFSISYTQHSNNLPLYWVSFSSELCFIYYYARVIILNGIIKSVYESISTFFTTAIFLETNFAFPGHEKHSLDPILLVPYCPVRESLVLQLSLSHFQRLLIGQFCQCTICLSSEVHVTRVQSWFRDMHRHLWRRI